MSKSQFTIDKDNLEVRTTRIFKATPERLYEAYTDPEQIPQWWGPADYTTIVDKMDVQIGGAWRFVQTEPGGKEHAFKGVYKVLDKPNKISDTFEYEPIPGHVLLETTTFEALPDGTTQLITAAKYDNLQDLEGMVSMGMEEGQTESMERLATLLEKAE
jgi:uncharacterized protein YndB with AHSA1/START domain